MISLVCFPTSNCKHDYHVAYLSLQQNPASLLNYPRTIKCSRSKMQLAQDTMDSQGDQSSFFQHSDSQIKVLSFPYTPELVSAGFTRRKDFIPTGPPLHAVILQETFTDRALHVLAR